MLAMTYSQLLKTPSRRVQKLLACMIGVSREEDVDGQTDACCTL